MLLTHLRKFSVDMEQTNASGVLYSSINYKLYGFRQKTLEVPSHLINIINARFSIVVVNLVASSFLSQ